MFLFHNYQDFCGDGQVIGQLSKFPLVLLSSYEFQGY